MSRETQDDVLETDRRHAANAVEQLQSIDGGGTHVIDVDGRRIRLTNVDKVMYPSAGFTKLDVIGYYAAVAPSMLPHLRDRALTMKRYPDGVGGEPFFQKRCPDHAPNWVTRSPRMGSGQIRYCMALDVATLIWAANLAALELHLPLARADEPSRPTVLVFDLDPGENADILDCAYVALEIRALFSARGIQAYPKTSGSKGLQVYVPLNQPETTFDDTKAFAHAVAHVLATAHPDIVVHDMKRSLRRGKVLIDWSQNDESKTTVSAYSLRARERPTVSTPVHWSEVERACDRRDADALSFTADDVLERIAREGDLFAPVLERTQSLWAEDSIASSPPARKQAAS